MGCLGVSQWISSTRCRAPRGRRRADGCPGRAGRAGRPDGRRRRSAICAAMSRLCHLYGCSPQVAQGDPRSGRSPIQFDRPATRCVPGGRRRAAGRLRRSAIWAAMSRLCHPCRCSPQVAQGDPRSGRSPIQFDRPATRCAHRGSSCPSSVTANRHADHCRPTAGSRCHPSWARAASGTVRNDLLLTSPISVSRDRVLLCSVPVPSDADQDRQTTPTSEKRKRRSSVQWQVS
jgi:hypothetical protein